MHKYKYPIETELQMKFWGSRHKCNKMKSMIAFSENATNANDNLRRQGYTFQWRKKAIINFLKYINCPSMIGIPYSQTNEYWWECMPFEKIDDKTNRWTPNFTGAAGEALSTNKQFVITEDDYFEFNTEFCSEDMNKLFTILGTDDPQYSVIVDNGVVRSEAFTVTVNGAFVNDIPLYEGLRGKNVKVHIKAKDKAHDHKAIYYFGGDTVTPSISTYIDSVRYFSLDNIDDSVFWYAVLGEKKPEHLYYHALDTKPEDRLIFKKINDWKRYEVKVNSLDGDWEETLKSLDNLC